MVVTTSDCISALQLQVETVQKVPVLTEAVCSAVRVGVNLCAWAVLAVSREKDAPADVLTDSLVYPFCL